MPIPPADESAGFLGPFFIEKRFEAHCTGKGAKYTKSHKPKAIVYQESFDTKDAAMAREYQIKHMSRKQKLDLIASNRILEKEAGTEDAVM